MRKDQGPCDLDSVRADTRARNKKNPLRWPISREAQYVIQYDWPPTSEVYTGICVINPPPRVHLVTG